MVEPAKRSLRELMIAARAKWGAAASSLKTREELERALESETPPVSSSSSIAPLPAVELVLEQFFVPRVPR